MKRLFCSLSLCLTALILVSCKDPVEPGKAKPPKTQAITINGEVLTQSDFISALEPYVSPKAWAKIREDLQERPLTHSQLRAELEKRVGSFAAKKAWDRCVYQSLAEQAIRKAKVEIDDKEVDPRLKQEMAIYKKSPSSAWMSYEQFLKSKGSSLEKRRAELKRELALDKIIGAPTDKEIRGYFDENRDDYSGRKLELFHILLKDKTEALRVQRALERGDDFGKLARAHSQEKSSAKKDGRVGWVRRRGDVPRDLGVAAFRLVDKKESFGGPVKTSYGWHLFRVGGQREGQDVNFEEVRERMGLALRKLRRVQFMIGLREKAKILGVK